MALNTFDYILLGIVALFILIGFFKGFFRSFLGLFSALVSLIAAIALTGLVTDWLLTQSFFANLFGHNIDLAAGTTDFGSVTQKLCDAIINLKADLLGVAVSGTSTEVAAELSKVIPGIIAKPIAEYVVGTETISSSLSLGQIITPIAMRWILLIADAILIFIVIRLVVAILNHIFKGFEKNKTFSAVNRLFGGLFNGAIGALIAIIILALCPYLMSIGGIPDNIKEMYNTSYIQTTYGEEILQKTNELTNYKKFIDELFPKKDEPTDENENEPAAYNWNYEG